LAEQTKRGDNNSPKGQGEEKMATMKDVVDKWNDRYKDNPDMQIFEQGCIKPHNGDHRISEEEDRKDSGYIDLLSKIRLSNDVSETETKKCTRYLFKINNYNNPKSLQIMFEKLIKESEFKKHSNELRDYCKKLCCVDKREIYGIPLKCQDCCKPKARGEETARLRLDIDITSKFSPEFACDCMEKLIELTQDEILGILYSSYNPPLKKNPKIEIVENDRNINPPDTITKSFTKEEIEYMNMHGLIQKALCDYLKNNFPNEKISIEACITDSNHIIDYNSRIDIYHEKENGIKVIYEIKNCEDLLDSVRIALGQLLEYAYYPNRNEQYKLIVVSNKFINEYIKEYIDNLNKKFNINIGIVNFDHEKNIISEHFNCNECNF
jgi:hypothetical protein